MAVIGGRRLVLVGAVAVGLGLVTLVDRGAAGLFDFGFLLVSAVGVLAAVWGLSDARTRWSSTRDPRTVDAPEPRHRSPAPGDGVDESLAGHGWGGGTRRAVAARNRLRTAAVETLVTYGGVDRWTAVEAVRNGTWTDDTVAASYLSVPSQVPPTVVLASLLRRESAAERAARRALGAIREVGEA